MLAISKPGVGWVTAVITLIICKRLKEYPPLPIYFPDFRVLKKKSIDSL